MEDQPVSAICDQVYTASVSRLLLLSALNAIASDTGIQLDLQ